MLTYIFKAREPKAQVVPPWARKRRSWKKASKKSATDIHQRGKTKKENDFQDCSVIVFTWNFSDSIRVSVPVQSFSIRCSCSVPELFSFPSHQISAKYSKFMVCSKEPLPSLIRAPPPPSPLHQLLSWRGDGAPLLHKSTCLTME